MARGRPTTVACAALPAVAKASDAAGVRMPAALVWQTMAWASGWLELDSTLAASDKTSSSRPDVKARTSVTRGFPSVRVPVLSNAMLLTRPMVSKAFRSEEHTSELQSLMRHSYAVFCLQKQTMLSSIIPTHTDENPTLTITTHK